MMITNTSGFRGVWWDKFKNKWHSNISVNNKTIHLGRFKNIKDAAKIYNQAALKYFGDFDILNNI